MEVRNLSKGAVFLVLKLTEWECSERPTLYDQTLTHTNRNRKKKIYFQKTDPKQMLTSFT